MEHFTLPVDYSLEDVVETIRSFIVDNTNPVIIITGATNSGKTLFSHMLYDKFNARLISADSRQIYKAVNIGSSKPRIKNHILMDGQNLALIQEKGNQILYSHLDILNLLDSYNPQKYREEVRKEIVGLHDKNILPIVTGGTIHWIKSLISSYVSPYYRSDEKVYMDLYSLSLNELQEKYREYYDKDLNNSDWNNKLRMARAIEYKIMTGHSLYESTKHIHDQNNYLIIQTSIDFNTHKEKVKKSVIDRISNGWIEEVDNIIKEYGEGVLDKLGQGYRVIGNYIQNNKMDSMETLVENITILENRYAKKQSIMARTLKSF